MKDWDDIRFVMEVVRHGGLQSAGAKIGVSHSTLSRRLSSLETKLNTILFDRISGRLVPTESALAIARAGEVMEKNAAELDLGLFAKKSELEGALKITAPALLIDGFLAEHLTEFAQAYPKVALKINAAHSNLNLNRREADVAIRATNSPDEGLFGRRLCGQARTVFASPTYLDRCQDQLAKNGHRSLDWLGFDWWKDEEVVQPGDRIIARFDDMTALRASLRNGMGVSKLPCFLGDPDDGLVRVPGFEASDYVDFWVLTHASLKDVALVRLFMSFISERFDEAQDLFMGINQPKKE